MLTVVVVGRTRFGRMCGRWMVVVWRIQRRKLKLRLRMRMVCWHVCFGSRQFDMLSQDGHERSGREIMIDISADGREEDSLRRLGPQLVFCWLHMLPNFCYNG